MRSTSVAATLSIVLLLLTIAFVPSMGENLTTRLNCPSSVAVGEFARLDLHLENQLCEVRSVRILSTVVSNDDETAGGVGIVGPAVAMQSVAVPAATDLLSGVCSLGQCEGFVPFGFAFCASDLDCVCRGVTAGVTDVEINVPTPFPAAFSGTIVRQFIFADAMDGTKTIIASCLVPEPVTSLQLATALATLTFLHHRAKRARNPEENPS